MKRLLGLLGGLLLASGLFAQTTLTGQVLNAVGQPYSGNGTIFFVLSQNGNVSSAGSCGGPYQVGPNTPVSFPLTAGSIGSVTITGNDCIIPAGTFFRETVTTSDGQLVVSRNVSITGASANIGTLPLAQLPSGIGAGVPSSRLINTTSPLSGGGDLTADRTLTAVVTPPGAGSFVGSSRSINTSAPVTGGGDLSADRTIGVSQFSSGASGIVPASGGGVTNFMRADGSWSPPGTGTGGVNSQTISYTAVAGDSGKLVSMNGANLTLTLPAAPPSATWYIGVENLAATALTVARNGLTIDGAAANLTVVQNNGLFIYTDGANYFTSQGVGVHSDGTTPLTADWPVGKFNVYAKNGTHWFNVKDGYGAKGDGATDDTTAIQNAINAAVAAGGGTVYFPPTGSAYEISSTLNLNNASGNQVTLLGDSWSGSSTKGSSIAVLGTMTSTPMLTIDGSGVAGNGVYVQVQNLIFNAGSTTATQCIKVNAAWFVRLSNVYATGGTSESILIQGAGTASSTHVLLDHCRVGNAPIGVHYSGYATTGCSILDSEIAGTTNGIVADSTNGYLTEVHSSVVEGCGGPGVRLEGSSVAGAQLIFAIYNTDFEGNTNADVTINPSAATQSLPFVTLIGNRFQSAVTNGVLMNANTKSLNIFSCTFASGQTNGVNLGNLTSTAALIDIRGCWNLAATPISSSNPAITSTWYTPQQKMAFTNTTNSTTISNTNALTTYSTTKTIPANTLAAGSQISVKFVAFISTDAGGSTFLWKVRIGGTVVQTSATTASQVSAASWQVFCYPFNIVMRTGGAGGTAFAEPMIVQGENATPATAFTVVGTNNSGAIAVNTTVANTVDVQVQMGTATVGDTTFLASLDLVVVQANVAN